MYGRPQMEDKRLKLALTYLMPSMSMMATRPIRKGRRAGSFPVIGRVISLYTREEPRPTWC